MILYHARFWLFGGGFVGVDAFFVISGFVITGHLVRHDTGSLGGDLRDFYTRRIRRIVPAASVVLVLTVLLGYECLGSNFDPSLLGDARWASLFSANFRFISTSSSYFISGVPPSLIQHFWSLAVEEQFYFVWPIILLSVNRWTPVAVRRQAVIGVLAVLVATSAWWSWHDTVLHSTTAYYSPFTRGWELGLGALVALVPSWPRDWSRLAATRTAAVALGALFAAAVLQRSTLSFPGIAAWWPCAATAAVLWVGTAPTPTPVSTFLSHPIMTRIGDRSYSLYLYHFAWLEIPLQLVHPVSGFIPTVFEIAATAVCAEISYRVIENPIRHSRRLGRDPIAVVLILLVSIAAVWDATWWVGRLGHF